MGKREEEKGTTLSRLIQQGLGRSTGLPKCGFPQMKVPPGATLMAYPDDSYFRLPDR